MESIFAFLFKYRPLLFEQGSVVFRSPVPVAVLVLAGAAAILLSAWTYRRPMAKATAADRVALVALRTGAVAVLVFCLMRPALLLSSVVPQQNYLGILIDDSRSMRIADDGGVARSEFVARTFAEPDAALLRALQERFQLRFFRFSDQVHRVDAPAALTYDGARTSIAPALDRVREELGALPLSGVVLVTDGADGGAEAGGAASPLSESLLALRAAGVPVFPVGVGRESYDADIELSRVSAPREALTGTSLVVDLMVSQTGFSGQKVTILVEDEGRIVGSEEITLPRAGEPAPVRVQFTATEPGARRFRFRVPARDNERVAENNQQEALIHVRAGREKILYFEGEPRWEVKFLRQAVQADSNLQVVTLQRTADGKYMRLDVDSAGELFSGFPTTREELFTYRALILGSIEASHFTHEQMRMIAEFISERGGGLLMLGGRHAFAEGGYAGTPIADVLPVALDARHSRDTTFFDTLTVRLTRAGAAQPALRVAASERDSEERWRTLPAPTTYNRVGELKPGAVALLQGNGRRSGDNRPVLAWQRYGRGQSFALPLQDTWIWQMHGDIPLEDQTHELFWRQLLRWLVSGVPQPVTATLAADHVAPGDPIRITADVSDETFAKVNDGRVVAVVTAPDGSETEVPMSWTPGRDGQYHATHVADAPGLYTVRVSAERNGRTLAGNPAYAFAEDRRDEYFGSQMRGQLLRRIADETGGRFYTAANAAALADDITYAGRGMTIQEERDLWDMPILFLLLVTFLGAEWGYRRLRGLA